MKTKILSPLRTGRHRSPGRVRAHYFSMRTCGGKMNPNIKEKIEMVGVRPIRFICSFPPHPKIHMSTRVHIQNTVYVQMPTHSKLYVHPRIIGIRVHSSIQTSRGLADWSVRYVFPAAAPASQSHSRSADQCRVQHDSILQCGAVSITQ